MCLSLDLNLQLFKLIIIIISIDFFVIDCYNKIERGVIRYGFQYEFNPIKEQGKAVPATIGRSIGCNHGDDFKLGNRELPARG